MEKFQVGDRVKNVSKTGFHAGMIGTITGRQCGYEGHYYVKYDDGDETHTSAEDYELCSFPTLTISGKTYEIVKEISGRSLYTEERAECAEWRSEFEAYVSRYGFTVPAIDSNSHDIEIGLACHDKWPPWLLSNGYLREKKAKRVVMVERCGWFANAEESVVPYDAGKSPNFSWDSLIGKTGKLTFEYEE